MATSEIKHIAILLPIVWSIRNVVTSGLAERLVAAGMRVTLLPRRTDGFDCILPRTPGVGIQPLLTPAPGKQMRGSFLLKAICTSAFQHRHGMRGQWRTFRKSRREKGAASDVRSFLTEAFGWAFQPRLLYRTACQLNAKIYRRENDLTPIYQQLRTLKPDLLCSTACVDGREPPYAWAAQDLGIRTVASILSFDNLTSRSEIPPFDAYMVWNSRMQGTLLRMYPQVKPENVHVTGTPQFDFHRRAEFRWTREDTLRRLGVPPGARYILYTANHFAWTPTEPELVYAFAERLAQTIDLAELRIVVRLHPLDNYLRWQRQDLGSRKVIVCRPWLTPSVGDWVPIGPDDQRLLVSSFAHGEMCVNMCSTTALDAAVLDRPVIGIAFAAVPGSSEDRVYREAYQSLHYKPLVESGGLRLAKSWDDLLALVRRAIEQPRCDRQERQKMAERECGVVDGHATDRMLGVFKSLLAKHAAPGGVRAGPACPSTCQ
jgi:hypothetical protein